MGEPVAEYKKFGWSLMPSDAETDVNNMFLTETSTRCFADWTFWVWKIIQRVIRTWSSQVSRTALVGDIRKAFLQVRIRANDRDALRFH